MKFGGKMSKPAAVLFILFLAAASLLASSSTSKTCTASFAFSASPPSNSALGNVPTDGAAFFSATFTPKAQPQSPSQSQPTSAVDASLPSPLVVAALIVGLVAVFGALLSFYWGRHHGKSASRATGVGERFWAID